MKRKKETSIEESAAAYRAYDRGYRGCKVKRIWRCDAKIVIYKEYSVSVLVFPVRIEGAERGL